MAKRIYRDFAEGAYIISFIGMVPQPMVVSNNIGNFPAYGFTYWPLRTPSNAFPEQWFLRQR